MITHNPELCLAEEFVQQTGCNLFLTGKAGTGKTTFLHNIRKNCNKRMVVTAPTGVAAINAGGVTLHSLFQLPFGPFVPGGENNWQHKFSREKINLLKSLNLLIIDEISMVRADLLDSIDHVLRRYRRSNASFGGVQLLLIGDLHQLAPVVKPGEWQLLKEVYDSPYFFSSMAIRQTELITVELTHIYRQSDHKFISLLNKVRDNSVNAETLTALNKRYNQDLADTAVNKPGYITLCSHNSSADSINEKRLAQLKNRVKIFDAVIEGDFPEKSYPTPPELTLKVGAQVMFIKNDSSHEKRFFNGKIGEITKITKDTIQIRCPGERDDIIVEPATWDNIQYSLNEETMEVEENRVGSFIQYPLKLAWAITIHKSQGLTFDKAIIDAEAAFSHGQVYVALSRCRTLEGIVLSTPLRSSSIKIDKTVHSFTQQAAANPPDPAKLQAEKIRYQQSLILDCFSFTTLHSHLDWLCRVFARNKDLLRLPALGNPMEFREEIAASICRVGVNFGNQLRSMFSEEIMPTEDPLVSERILKAQQYFLDKLQTRLAPKIADLEPETDNKETRKQAMRVIDRLREEAGVKTAGITSCSGGFTVTKYLRAIAEAELIQKKKSPSARKTPAVTYVESDIEHPELYTQLKTWRTTTAKDQNLPPFQVMHQKTLVQISVHLPSTITELKKIKGIGDTLAYRYGQEIIKLVNEYRASNDIKTVHLPKQSSLTDVEISKKPAAGNTRQETFKLYKEGLSPAEIAAARSLTVQTIEKHLTHFVSSGEIDLHDLVSLEKQRLIEEALKAGQRKLGEVKAELGENISYGEIHYVRAALKAQEKQTLSPSTPDKKPGCEEG